MIVTGTHQALPPPAPLATQRDSDAAAPSRQAGAPLTDKTAEPANGSAARVASEGGVSGGDRAAKPNGEKLSDAELRQLERLKVTDQEVRRHELAHQVAGGQHTGAVSYEFERGVNGQRYAVAGEVSVDYSPVPGDPGATVRKMEQVISAALAPLDPSPQDRQVAATARQYLLGAQLEQARQQDAMNQAREAGRGDVRRAGGHGVAALLQSARTEA